MAIIAQAHALTHTHTRGLAADFSLLMCTTGSFYCFYLDPCVTFRQILMLNREDRLRNLTISASIDGKGVQKIIFCI